MLRKKIRIGDLLVEQGWISQEQLEQAIATQKGSGRELGRQVIELGLISEDQMIDLLSAQLNTVSATTGSMCSPS